MLSLASAGAQLNSIVNLTERFCQVPSTLHAAQSGCCQASVL
jgi:hypothetical protein